MTADIETAVDDETTDASALDAAINAALDGGDAAEAPAGAARERAENGQFKSKQTDEGGTSDAAAEPTATETAAPVDAKPVTDAPVAPKWTDGHFTGWKPEQRERFAALPPDVQTLVMERQQESQAFYTRKLGEESEYRRQTEPIAKAAQDVEPYARSIGIAPHDLMRNYAAIDQQLRYAPYADKVALIGKIAHTYGVPFAQPEPDPYADPVQPNGQAYPVIHDLQSQVQYLTAQLSQYQQQMKAEEHQRYSSQINAFATARTPDGQLKNPLFETVKQAMGPLLLGGHAQTLEEAYGLAAKPLQEQIAAQVEARQKAAVAATAASLAKAKKAAPIRSSALAGGKTKGSGLDSVLDGALSGAGF